MYYPSGAKYIGDWKNDIREGKGVYFWDGLNRYEGDFKNDFIEGKGKMYYDNGDICDGEWYHNIRNGVCLYYHNDVGKWRKELYKNDVYMKPLSDFI